MQKASRITALWQLVAGARPDGASGNSRRPTGSADPSSAGSGQASSKDGFRPDVEGLKAVAVVAVLLYHAGVPFAPGGYGGVDGPDGSAEGDEKIL
jgi:hypothetical protein